MSTHMTIDTFLTEFQDLMQRDDPIDANDILKDMEEWDSMSMMACMAWFDAKLDIKLPYKVFTQQTTVQDIINLAQGRIS